MLIGYKAVGYAFRLPLGESNLLSALQSCEGVDVSAWLGSSVPRWMAHWAVVGLWVGEYLPFCWWEHQCHSSRLVFLLLLAGQESLDMLLSLLLFDLVHCSSFCPLKALFLSCEVGYWELLQR